jgi:hypothetical protein
MTNKVYKSAMGRPIDLGALILENENVRAVGNMNVNSRGDVIDSANRVIDPKNRSVQRQYKKQIVNTSELLSNAPTQDKKKQVKAHKLKEYITETVVEDSVVESVDVVQSVPRGGLAAAIARSQAVKQELMKTPRQLAQERAGVKKI